MNYIYKSLAVSSLIALMVSAPPAFAEMPKAAEQCKLNILLTNDDGWDAPGIQTLLDSLRKSAHNVTLVAPLTQQSGRSSGINTSVGETVSIIEQADGVWSVDGTPADSVKAALGIVMADTPPDLTISGANFGPNVGMQTVLNSGTLGASLTSHHAGVPAIAVSVGIKVEERDTTPPFKSTFAGFNTAAEFLNRLMGDLIQKNGCATPLGGNHILSVNVPVSSDKVKGAVYAPLSHNELFYLIWKRDADGENRIGFKPTDRSVGAANDDVGYFVRGYITVTPIKGDLTAPSVGEASWMPKLVKAKVVQ